MGKLVLARNAADSGPCREVVITLPDGRRVVVAVVRAEQGRADLAIEAPPDVVIFRGEVQRSRDAGVKERR